MQEVVIVEDEMCFPQHMKDEGLISLNNVVHMKVITYSIVLILQSQAYLRGKIQLNRPKCQRRDSFATQQWDIKTGRFWSSDLGGRKKQQLKIT